MFKIVYWDWVIHNVSIFLLSCYGWAGGRDGCWWLVESVRSRSAPQCGCVCLSIWVRGCERKGNRPVTYSILTCTNRSLWPRIFGVTTFNPRPVGGWLCVCVWITHLVRICMFACIYTWFGWGPVRLAVSVYFPQWNNVFTIGASLRTGQGVRQQRWGWGDERGARRWRNGMDSRSEMRHRRHYRTILFNGGSLIWLFCVRPSFVAGIVETSFYVWDISHGHAVKWAPIELKDRLLRHRARDRERVEKNICMMWCIYGWEKSKRWPHGILRYIFSYTRKYPGRVAVAAATYPRPTYIISKMMRYKINAWYYSLLRMK